MRWKAGPVASTDNWAVIGGTGFVGSELTRRVQAEDCSVVRVRAPRLSLPPNSSPAATVAFLRGLHGIVDDVAAELRGATFVVNAAGMADPAARDTPALWGANALLPVVIAAAADRVGARRFVHISSAAVQGRSRVLDETVTTAAFSPYSRSKAVGEGALIDWSTTTRASALELVIVRATSVQGRNRKTTDQLVRLARLPIASYAAPGTNPTPVSSVEALGDFVVRVAEWEDSVPSLVLQPWEGMTTKSLLRAAGARHPVPLPAGACKLVLAAGYLGSRIGGNRLGAIVRRIELMWFGQGQSATWSEAVGLKTPHRVADTLTASSIGQRK